MDGLEAFLDSYGVAAACAIMLIKAAGVPVPIPGDVILLATAARAAEGKVLLWLAFAALLGALIVGGGLQFYLARGPARRLVMKHGGRVGLTEHRLEQIAASVRRGGLFGIGLAVLTPGVRSAVVPACGLTGIAWRLFLPGLALGSAIDLGLHFAIGYAGSGILATIAQPAPLLVVLALALVGLAAWFLIARGRHASATVAVNAWAQATCPVCLVLGSLTGEALSDER
ncbi:MAG: VTT domain-containing protein [Chloroflexi bacterium]|nr:VTT domain-containing protein [Chloroflexota bacterium]